MPERLTPNAIIDLENEARRTLLWQVDGVEAGVAIIQENSLAFFVNGKATGVQ